MKKLTAIQMVVTLLSLTVLAQAKTKIPDEVETRSGLMLQPVMV